MSYVQTIESNIRIRDNLGSLEMKFRNNPHTDKSKLIVETKPYNLWLHEYVPMDDMKLYFAKTAILICADMNFRVEGKNLEFTSDVMEWIETGSLSMPTATWVWDDDKKFGTSTLLVICFENEQDRLLFRLRWL